VDLQQRNAKLLKAKEINGVGVFGQLFQQKLASYFLETSGKAHVAVGGLAIYFDAPQRLWSEEIVGHFC